MLGTCAAMLVDAPQRRDLAWIVVAAFVLHVMNKAAYRRSHRAAP
jgi:hypothetical protein